MVDGSPRPTALAVSCKLPPSASVDVSRRPSRVTVPASFNRSAVANRLTPTRCPRVFDRHSRWRSMAEWRAAGIQPLSGRWPDGNVQATLLEPDGPGRTAYLLTGNYRAILDYNCSNFYALSVGLLADEIDR